MAKTKSKAKRPSPPFDGLYVLKLLLYILMGTLWVKLSNGQSIHIGLPAGFIIGLILTSHERFRIDRKIEYAVLLVAMLFGYFAPYGLYINF